MVDHCDPRERRRRATRLLLVAGRHLVEGVGLLPWQVQLATRVVVSSTRELVALGHEQDAREIVLSIELEQAARRGRDA